MKKWVRLASLVASCLVPTIFIIGCSQTQKITKIHNAGLLKNNQQLTPQTLFLSENVLSLTFIINANANLLTGTGWLFDLELHDPNKSYEQIKLSDVKAFYIATNIHVINLVAALKDKAKLKISQAKPLNQIKLNENEFNDDLVADFNSNNEFESFIKINKNAHEEQENSFSILPIGLNNSNKNTKAVDIAILRVIPSPSQKEYLPWLKNMRLETLPSFSSFNDVTNKDFYSAGYAVINQNKTKLPYYHQFKGNNPQLIAPFKKFWLDKNQKSINYRTDNPIYYDENVLVNKKSITNDLVKKINEYKYHAYDYSYPDFNLGPGASGSPVVDSNNNFVGIYWGGFRVLQNNQQSQFYGNFSPLIYQKEDIQQDLLANYLQSTLKYNTFLDQNFATKYLISNLNQTNKEQLKVILNKINSNQKIILNQQKDFKLVFDFILSVQNQFKNINSYNQLVFNNIERIELIKTLNQKVELLVKIIFKKQLKNANYFYLINN